MAYLPGVPNVSAGGKKSTVEHLGNITGRRGAGLTTLGGGDPLAHSFGHYGKNSPAVLGGPSPIRSAKGKMSKYIRQGGLTPKSMVKYALLFGALLIATPARADVDIPCGANIDAAIAANPAGTIFHLAAACIYENQVFTPKNDIVLLGAGPGSTILDGTHTTNVLVSAPPPYGGNGATGVVIDGVTIQNYAGSDDTSANNTAQMYAWKGWVIRNCIVTGSRGWGISIPGATLSNCRVIGNRHGGVTAELGLQSTNATTVTGNEIAYNNTRRDNADNDAAGLKIVELGSTLVITNNYVHDNYSTGLWLDIGVGTATISGNTVVHNSYHGIQWEISPGPAGIFNNVVNDNGWDSTMPIAGDQIFISSAGGADVHDNNVRVPVAFGVWQPHGIVLQADNRGDAVAENNVTFHDNTVTFLGSGGGQGFANNNSVVVTGTSSNNNHFYVSDTGDSHWYWNAAATSQSWSDYKTATSQDLNSTLSVGAQSVSGCLRAGCSGSGWPQ